MSAPPSGVDRERWARLLAAAEVARRGGTAREVRREGRVLLEVTGANGERTEVRVVSAGSEVPEAGEARIVVDARAEGTRFHLHPARRDAGAEPEPPRDGWALLGL